LSVNKARILQVTDDYAGIFQVPGRSAPSAECFPSKTLYASFGRTLTCGL
jgi:hypothetical protein